MPGPGAFNFLDPGHLCDGELAVRLVDFHPAEPIRGWVPWYEFSLHSPEMDLPVGQLSFRAGHGTWFEKYGGHIGYGVEPSHRGRHFAERAVRLLLPFIRQHGFERIWITCNPDNWASRRTCERLGAIFVGIVAVPSDHDMYQRGERQKCRYRLEL